LLLLLVRQEIKLQLLLHLLEHQQVELCLVARFIQLALQPGNLPLQLLGITLGTGGSDGGLDRVGDTLSNPKPST
jgi:hypothetical protein